MKTAEKDLYTNAAQDKILGEGDPEVAFLVARKGQTVPDDFAHLVKGEDKEAIEVYQVQQKVGEKPVDALLKEQDASNSTLDAPGSGDDLTTDAVNAAIKNPTPGGPDDKKDVPVAQMDHSADAGHTGVTPGAKAVKGAADKAVKPSENK